MRSGDCTVRTVAETLRANGRALEGMPYGRIKEMEILALQLEVAAVQDEDGFLPNIANVLAQVEDWLRSLPPDAA